jgi:glycosyltransferase involved in cell wall biosynthesis
VTRQRGAAIVHFDHFAYFDPVPGALNVRAPHNVESVIARQEVAHQRGYGRIWHEAEWRKLRALERRCFRESDLCVAVSELDAQAFAEAGAPRTVVCPNGTDPVAPRPIPRRGEHDPLRSLFVGTGDYPPYARGIAWFVEHVLPHARTRIPVTLDVVGRKPPDPVAAAGVQYHGPVPDVAEWYERAHVAIVPVFDGSGTRLKIVEAMAYGRPVISTRLGAEGLPIRAPDHYLEADSAEAFASALVAIANWCCAEDEALSAMLDRAHEAIEPLFWPEVVRDLAAVYRSSLEAPVLHKEREAHTSGRAL